MLIEPWIAVGPARDRRWLGVLDLLVFAASLGALVLVIVAGCHPRGSGEKSVAQVGILVSGVAGTAAFFLAWAALFGRIEVRRAGVSLVVSHCSFVSAVLTSW